MSSFATLYEVLGLAPQATSLEIDAAHAERRQSIQGNPDDLSLLAVAYDTLRHPEQRAAYDRKLARRRADAVAKAVTPPPRRVGSRPGVWVLLLLAGISTTRCSVRPSTSTPSTSTQS